jgi:hypothetical protein
MPPLEPGAGQASQAGCTTTIHRRAEPRARFLLIVNKGPGALEIPREGDAWDLMDIYFMKKDIEAVSSDPARSQADFVVFETSRNMRKFAIIKRAFEQLPALWHYEAVMMLDDDLVPVGCSIADIFESFMKTGFRVGQPALSADSYWSHEVVLRNPRFVWRCTNFVEVMCPIMLREAMREYIGLFDETISAFGLDVYWSSKEWEVRGGVVVLDSTPMRHTRPVRGGVAYQGISPGEERYAFYRKHRLRNYRHLTLGGWPAGEGRLMGGLSIRNRSQFSDLVKFRLNSAMRRMGFVGLLGLAVVRNVFGGNTGRPIDPSRRQGDSGKGIDS